MGIAQHFDCCTVPCRQPWGWTPLIPLRATPFESIPLRTCFSYCIALASQHLFEQTATAGDFCLCTDFEQLLAVAPSPALRSALPLVGSPSGWEEQNSRNPPGVIEQQRDGAQPLSREPAGELYRPNVELAESHRWKMGAFYNTNERRPCMGNGWLHGEQFCTPRLDVLYVYVRPRGASLGWAQNT